MAYPDTLDQTKPTDANYLKEGAARIRETRAAIRERLLTIFTDPDADPLVFLNQIIPTAALIDLAVTLAKLAPLSVDTSKLVDLAVTDDKIAGMDGSKLTDATVAGTKLEDLAVSLSKLAANSVDASKIVDGSVGTAELADASVTGPKVPDAALSLVKLDAAAHQDLVKQQHTDFSVGTFVLATNTSWDSPDIAIPGATELDSLIVSPKYAAALWTAPMKLITFYAFMSSAGNAKLRLQNNTGGPATIPDSDWRILALRRLSDWP